MPLELDELVLGCDLTGAETFTLLLPPPLEVMSGLGATGEGTYGALPVTKVSFPISEVEVVVFGEEDVAAGLEVDWVETNCPLEFAT